LRDGEFWEDKKPWVSRESHKAHSRNLIVLHGAGYSHWELSLCALVTMAIISSLSGGEQTAVIYTLIDLRV